jgi:hypothetical protein
MRGLGDLIAWVLTPLQPLIRRFYGSKDCGCKQRQEVLNRKFPFQGLSPEEIEKYHSKRKEFNEKIEKFLKENPQS